MIRVMIDGCNTRGSVGEGPGKHFLVFVSTSISSGAVARESAIVSGQT